eukprot:1155170-Pelagomonas_calceolata.AAC.1
MLGTNSSTLRRVAQADLKLQSKDDKCWTAQIIQAFQDLRYRLQGAWREVESVDPGGNSNKLATCQAWFATPFACNAHQTYVPLPWYLFLDVPKQVMCNVSRCSCNQIQDEAHVLLNCTDVHVCSLRRKRNNKFCENQKAAEWRKLASRQ